MVFLKDGASSSEIQSMTRQMQELASGRTVTYLDKSQALQAFRKSLGEDASMLDGLDADNPLPASLQVQLTSPDEAESVYEAVLGRFRDSPRVESVRYSRGVVQQIKNMLRLVQVVGALGMAFLFLIAGFIIANTIKLALYNHRTEVEIMQLVGARRAAICAPYLLEGFIQGVLGAAVGLLGVFVVFLIIRNFLHRAEILQAMFPSFTFIPGFYIGGTLIAGAVVGVVGSFLAVRRFLSET
jgi:cell division transport system permease protein